MRLPLRWRARSAFPRLLRAYVPALGLRRPREPGRWQGSLGYCDRNVLEQCLRREKTSDATCSRPRRGTTHLPDPSFSISASEILIFPWYRLWRAWRSCSGQCEQQREHDVDPQRHEGALRAFLGGAPGRALRLGTVHPSEPAILLWVLFRALFKNVKAFPIEHLGIPAVQERGTARPCCWGHAMLFRLRFGYFGMFRCTQSTETNYYA